MGDETFKAVDKVFREAYERTYTPTPTPGGLAEEERS